MKVLHMSHIAAVSVLLLVPATLYSQTKTNSSATHVHGQYQPLNVKPGLWERTQSYQRAGKMPLPEGMLDKLTPEQRARFEARMKASSSANSKTDTEKYCITKEELEKPIPFNDKECTWTILESSSTKAKGTVSCNAEGITMTGAGDFEAVDPEHIRGSAHMTSTGNGNKMTTDVSFASKWLSSNCGELH